MNDILKYLFKPSTNNAEAIKSAYYESVKPTQITMLITLAAGILFLILTFVCPSYFGTEVIVYHQLCYGLLILIASIWCIGVHHALKDYENRYRTVYVLNHFISFLMYVWAIILAIVNTIARGTVDTTLFMMVALIVPLCIHIQPMIYILFAVVTNGEMMLFLSYECGQGVIEFNEVINFSIFFLFQLIMGLIMSYARYVMNNQLVTAEHQRLEIEKLNKSQNSFFSNMSHEIRTPINTIIGLNEMILREDVSDEVIEDAVNIKAAGNLLLSLINDILDMSKFQSGRMQLLIEPYQTGNMLSDIVGMLWLRAEDKYLDFNVNVSPDVPAELVGDEVRIKQILINVLNNAIKYTKEGSVSFTVQCEKKENKVCNMIYTISDTGIGIKHEDIPYLFSAFKRVDESTTKHIEGTGLGLSIVKQLVDLMGGKITVNSVYMKGSTFIIEIPQRIDREGNVGDYDFSKSGSGIGRKHYTPKFEAPKAKVLVVDDNESNIMVVSKLLRETKVQVHTATNGADALRKTLNTKYDVIFMDHLMPEMDGIECRKRIKEQTGGRCRDTDIVILTANADEENRALYARENFDGYLVKPVNSDDLETELYNHLPKEIVNLTNSTDEIARDTASWTSGVTKRKSVLITTESVADLPAEIVEKFGIAILPHKVQTEEGIFKDGKEIETLGILRYMEDPNHVVNPISPSVKEIEDFFAQQLSNANNVIHITLSGKLKNTGYDKVIEASKSFDNVFVIDSENLSSGMGLLAVAACKLAESGLTAEQIVKEINDSKKKVHMSFIVDNLDFLVRNGQVSSRTANLIKSLMGRPVLKISKGKIGLKTTYFGDREKSWKSYIDSVLTRGPIVDSRILFVTYVGLSKQDTDWIKEQIEKTIHVEKIYFIQASPAIAVNSGPGTFGMMFVER